MGVIGINTGEIDRRQPTRTISGTFRIYPSGGTPPKVIVPDDIAGQRLETEKKD